MAELWIKPRPDRLDSDYTQVEFSTGYVYGFFRLVSNKSIRVIGGSPLELGKKYLIKRVRICKEESSIGFWWLGEGRHSYFEEFRKLLDEIAPGYLGRKCLITQIVVERIE
jgi:hypothetical protein